MDHVISTPALRAALRFSLTSTWRSSPVRLDTLSISDGDRATSPGLRKLIEGILYSRRLVLSYHVIIVGLLIVFTLVHWAGWLQKWRRRRRGINITRETDDFSSEQRATNSLVSDKHTQKTLDEHGETSSSSSSTIHGSGTSPRPFKVGSGDTEETALLLKHPIKPSQGSPYLSSHIRAWLNYQPRPIPVVNKVLPANGTTMAVILFILLNIFYMFYRVPFSIPMIFVFADRTSIMFVANLPLLYLLAAKNQPVKLLTGYSYESLNILHRRLGELMCLLALLHSAGMLAVWYTLLRPTGFTLARFVFARIIILGIGAFVAYEAIYLTSLGSFRQRWYELFLGLHVCLQVVALVLVWFHHLNSRIYVGVALAIFLVDRLAYRMTIKTKTLLSNVKILEDGETVGLSMVVPLNISKGLSTLVGHDIGSGWRPTEHVFLTIPSLGRKHIFQAHPFTIASRAPISSDLEAFINLIVRAQDGFSADLMRYAKCHNSVAVRLDGPYGSQSAVELLRGRDLAVVIAGGSGIAVALPLVWSLIGSSRDDDLECRTAGLPQKVYLIWVVHKRAHFSWIGEGTLALLQRRGVEVLCPGPTEDYGRPDLGLLIEQPLRSCNSLPHDQTVSAGVVCSGPESMNRTVRNICSSSMARGRDVDVAIEKFGW